MVPPELKKISNLVKSNQPESQSIKYYSETWKRHLPGDLDMNFIVSRFPCEISRTNLFQLSYDAQKSGLLKDIRRLFIATMMWGYGTGGRGPWRTNEMLSTRDINSILIKSFNLVLEGKLINAYETFIVKQCGQPYFSKFFYFIGYGNHQPNYPLILDTRVWEALRDRLLIDTSLYVKSSSWWYPRGYIRYVNDMHEWAHELGCEAHQIEYTLFQLGKK